MKKIIPIALFILTIGNAFAQLSPAGSYLGKAGNNDILITVGRRDAINFMVLDYLSRSVDLTTLAFGSTNSASGLTPRGRSYSLSIKNGVAIGSYGGVDFTATKMSLLGPNYNRGGQYNGIVQDRSKNTAIGVVNFFPDGRVFFFYGNDTLVGGIGQVSGTGQVAISMTDGTVHSFSFRPDPTLLVAANGAITINGVSTLSYLFFSSSHSRLSNIATRGVVTPSAPMTAGFVITDWAKTVLIRGIGPALTQFGVTGANPDPQIFLFSGSSVIAANDNWNQNANTSELIAAAAQTGAFSLSAASRDAVLMVTLEPGAYTVQVASQGNAAGEALVEVYQID